MARKKNANSTAKTATSVRLPVASGRERKMRMSSSG
jgi:hypothetical protein